MNNIFIKKYAPIFLTAAAFIFLHAAGGPAFCADTAGALDSARACYDKGDYEAAIKILADILKDNPLNQEAFGMLSESQRLLGQRHRQLKEEAALKELKRLDREAQAFYDKGELSRAIKIWSKILEISPGDEHAAWMIQKTQTRIQIERGAVQAAESRERAYSKKVKDIADNISKLMEEAREKIRQEEEKRKQEELDALKERARQDETARAEEKQRAQKKEEAFILDTFKRGQEFYSKGKYEEAIREWESILPLLARDSELRRAIESLRGAIKKEAAAEPLPAPEPEPPAKPSQAEKPAPMEKPLPLPAEPVREAAKEPTKEPPPAKETVPEQEKKLTTAEKSDKLKSGAAPGRFKKLVLAVICILAAALALFLGFRKNIIRAVRAAGAGRIGEDFDPRKLKDFFENYRNKEKTDNENKDIFKTE